MLTSLFCWSSALGVQTICGKQQCLHPPDQPQTLLHDKACVALSFVLNVLATTLIGYKAWSVNLPPSYASSYTTSVQDVVLVLTPRVR